MGDNVLLDRICYFEEYRINMNNDFDLSKVFKALSNPNRLEIFLNILKKDGVDAELKSCFLSELTGHFSIGAPTISHHLKELVKAGLIETNKKGKFVTCQVNGDMVDKLQTVFNRTVK